MTMGRALRPRRVTFRPIESQQTSPTAFPPCASFSMHPVAYAMMRGHMRTEAPAPGWEETGWTLSR